MENKNNKKLIYKRILLGAVIFILLPLSVQAGNFIHSVKVKDGMVNLAAGGAIPISWKLSEQSDFSVYITDINGNIVKTLVDKEKMEKGAHTFTWDGRDDRDVACPDGVYFPILKGRSKRKGMDIFNPTSQPWGEDVLPETIKYHSKKQKILFSLSRLALCRIRVFIKDGGPMYKAITGWRMYHPGKHEEEWNGMDADNIIQVSDLENYQVGMDAFSLPQGTIFLTGSPTKPGEGGTGYKKYPIHPPHGNKVAYLLALPNSIAPDPVIAVQLSGDVQETDAGLIVKGIIAVQMEISPDVSAASHLREDFEMYLFVDGTMETELSSAKIPAVINWDTTKVANGQHVVTVNMLSSEDRAATRTMRVTIAN